MIFDYLFFKNISNYPLTRSEPNSFLVMVGILNNEIVCLYIYKRLSRCMADLTGRLWLGICPIAPLVDCSVFLCREISGGGSAAAHE